MLRTHPRLWDYGQWHDEDLSFGTYNQPQYTILPTSGTASNGKGIFSWDQAAAQLTRDWPNAGWNTTLGTSLTVTYAFRSTAPATMPEDTSGFSRFSSAQIVAAEYALQEWASVANITFIRAGSGTSGNGAYSNNATILFANYSAGAAGAAAFAYLATPGQTASAFAAGDVWVNSSLAENQSFNNLDYGAQVLLHEIGHALGLDHPGDYNANPNTTPTYGADAVYWQDTRMFTVMSYFGSVNTGGSLPGLASGPQLHDIAAIQLLYGANTNTRTGDTVYGFNSNTGEAHFSIASGSQGAVFSIWDGGGNDTLDLSGYSTNSNIDLRPESFSSAGPGDSTSPISTNALYNISIARGVTIENAIGGSGNDIITGNDVANVLDGGAGADAMSGGLGNDTYVVDNAGDAVTELAGQGTDTVNASINYMLTANVENLTLLGAVATGNGNGLANLVTGNAAANTLYGLDGADTLYGLDGNDTLLGGTGADAMLGGAGNDTYYVDNAGDVVTENSNEGTDTVNAWINYTLAANVENLTLLGAVALGNGNGLANILTGNSANNSLYGFDGADTLYGLDGNDTLAGGSGADIMVGGTGNDTYYVDNLSDVVTESANEGTDTVNVWISGVTLAANVENLTLLGSALSGTGNGLANLITGNANANTLDGGAGADTLIGGAGNDAFVFHAGEADGDTINDFDGQGAAAGDALSFSGYGLAADGASLVQLDATHWQINSADGTIHDVITLANGAAIDPSDYVFGP